MTLPDERYRALTRVPGELVRLLEKRGPIRKCDIRVAARSILRHYPHKYELEKIAAGCPELLHVEERMGLREFAIETKKGSRKK